MDIDYADSAKQMTRMANSLHYVLASRDVAVSSLACRVLGKLARTRSQLLADLLGTSTRDRPACEQSLFLPFLPSFRKRIKTSYGVAGGIT